MSTQDEHIALQARFAAIEYMFANLYVHFCEKQGVPPEMIKAQNEELRQRLATTFDCPPGVDRAHFALVAPHFESAVRRLLVQIEAMVGTDKTAT
jgi:hypothetical protein